MKRLWIVLVAATLVGASAVCLAKLSNGYGRRVTVDTDPVQVTFGGAAETVVLVNGAGGRVYYGYNCSTNYWNANIMTAAITNGMILEASGAATLYPDSGPYHSVVLECLAATSTVNVVAQ